MALLHTRLRLFGFVLTIISTLLSSGSLRADTVLWDNGPVAGDSRLCDSSSNLCGGGGALMVYDNFLVGSSIVTGFTFNDYVDDNGETGDAYFGTYWGIWASDPVTGAAPIASGTSVALLAAGAAGSALFTVTGLDISLSGGEYWLGTGNDLDASTLTDRAYTTSTVLPGWEQGVVGGIPSNLVPQPGTYGYTHSEFNTPFTIEGDPAPEPGTLLSTLSAFAAACAFRLRRNRKFFGKYSK